ncbi:MFS general substrate transporter [Ramaria rubella]|nr:MFS general substrate transporter [Ramaria rubella]
MAHQASPDIEEAVEAVISNGASTTSTNTAVPSIIDTSKQTGEEEPFTPYDLYYEWQRKLIVILVCITGTLSPLSSLLYTPALFTIASDLGVSVSKVNLTITTYLIFQGITPSFWGTLGDVYGRRLLYMVASIISIGACIGLSITNSYVAVLLLRALQAAGCTSTRALGAGVIRDLFHPSRRGGYMGFYSAGVGIGTAFGPVLGGILAQYVGWHGIFYFLLALSGVCLGGVYLFLPETLHGAHDMTKSKYMRPPFPFLCPSKKNTHALAASSYRPPPMPPLNFFGPLKLFGHPDVLCCVSFTGVCYTVWQNSMVATSTIYSTEYRLNQAEVGLTYIANGVGALVGNVITGKILDHDFQSQLRQENASREEGSAAEDEKQRLPKQQVSQIEHARLRSMRLAAPMFIACVIIFGWILQSHTHISVSIIAAFFIGWFDSSILTTYSTLMVDLFEQQASASSAIINLVRCLLGAVGTATIQPMIKALGTGWTFTTLGLICASMLPVIVIQYRYGAIWRGRRSSEGAKEELATVDSKLEAVVKKEAARKV